MGKREKFNVYGEIKRLEILENESRRIEGELAKNTNPEEADRVARQFFKWATELDEISKEISSNRSVISEFNYDGKVFTYKDKNKNEFYPCYNGLHFLKFWNENNISDFFPNKSTNGGARLLNFAEKKFVEIARGQLDHLINKEDDDDLTGETVKKEPFKNKESISSTPPRHISSDFFEGYEKQMEEAPKNQKDQDKK